MGQSIIPTENCDTRRSSNPPKEGAFSDVVEVIELSPEDSLTFAKAMLRPPKPSAALTRAFALHRKMVIGE